MGAASRRVLLAIHDPEQLPDLVDLACGLTGSHRHPEVYALHVVVIPRALPLDADMQVEVARGEALLAKAEEVAEARCGFRIRTDLLQAREPGPAILEEINEKAINVVVLGSRRHRAFTEQTLGGTVDYIIRHAPCRVVVAVPAEPAMAATKHEH